MLIDNNSTNPLVDSIIDGFVRRNMFYEVLRMKNNNRSNFINVMKDYESKINNYFFFVESDVEILTDGWDEIMMGYFVGNNYGFLGSAVDQTDYIDLSTVDLNEGDNAFLVKANSKEKDRPYDGIGILPIIPPGRLTIWKSDLFYSHINENIYSDGIFGKIVIAEGYKVGVVKEVKHRHLSLMNYYDCPNYTSVQRHNYFKN